MRKVYFVRCVPGILLLLPLLLYPQLKKGSFMAYGPGAKYLSNLNFSVYEAKNGFLWIGTQNGLVRFDGKRYRNFYADYANPDSPSDNSIMDIVEDKNGGLWFTGFYHGVTRYNQQTGRFKKYPRLSADNNDYYGIYTGLCDSRGDLWFCTAGRGLAKYDFEKDSFVLYFPEPSACRDGTVRGDNYVTSVCEDPYDRNKLWVGSFHGLYSFDKSSHQFRYCSAGISAQDGRDILINCLEADDRGNLWLGTWAHGLLCYNLKKGKFDESKARLKPDVVYHIRQVSNEHLYMAALNSGLWQYDLDKNTYTDITPPGYPGDPAVSKPDIQRISVTPHAGIFMGGNYYLYQQHPAYTRLEKNVTYPGRNKPKTDIYLQGFVWDSIRRKYWISTVGGNGLYELNEDFSIIKAAEYRGSSNLSGSYFRDPVIDARQRVWVLRANEGLCELTNKTRIFDRSSENIPVADSLLLHAEKMKTDNNGNIWMLSRHNFIYWDVRSNKAELFPIRWDDAYQSEKSLRGEMKIDPDGNAWLITLSGLFYCNRQEKKVEHIFRTGTGFEDLSTYAWVSGSFDKYNGLWLTASNGIQIFDRRTGKVLANHNTDGGLPTMRIIGIETDPGGRIWASTGAGLAFFDPVKKVWQLFNRNDGLKRDYLDNAFFITSNGKIIIDQVNGFVIKDASEIISEGIPPMLHLTSVIINEKKYADSLLAVPGFRLSLPYYENNIVIEFAAMDWLYPFRTTYWYTIEGPKSAISMSKSEDARIDLAGLQPGKYTVYLQALSGNGLWSEPIEFPVIIHPPFWKTTWFIGLGVLAVLTVIYFIYRYRLNQYKKLQAMRNNIARDLHDDIGASLSNIGILNELARINTGNPGKSAAYLGKAGEDIQRISESLGDIVWNINPRYDDLQNLFIRMKRYASDMFDGKNISYEMIFPDEVEKISLRMERRRDFYLIFKEAVNNLVKYSKATSAKVIVEAHRKKVIMIIRDNGIGFNSSQAHYGNGINNMMQRAAVWNDLLLVNSEPGRGTEVRLEMNIT